MAQASQVISQADQQKPASALPEVAVPGLGTAEVQQRIISGQTNALKEKTSRSIWQIIRANVFTLFNAIIFTAMILVLITGRWRDALFGFVLIINTGIGIFSEVRSKRTLDRLSILVEASYAVGGMGLTRRSPAIRSYLTIFCGYAQVNRSLQTGRSWRAMAWSLMSRCLPGNPEP